MTGILQTATYPGINSCRSCRYTCTLGTAPGVAVMEILPQPTAPSSDGSLVFVFGASTLTLPGCKVDFGLSRITAQGQITQVYIRDRRWRWKYADITGRYNVRLADGSIDSATEKTPQQLAQLLWTAIGEAGSVTQLPNDDRPYVDWTCDNAANALESLCSERGCSPGYDPVTNTVGIVRLGVGGLLPTDESQTIAFGFDPPEAPNIIKVCTGEAKFQSRLKLTAVALDNDGSVVGVDDVSYKPSDGWEKIHPSDLEGDLPQIADDNDRALAQQTVFKLFRIESQADGSQEVPGYGTVDSIKRLFPIRDELIETYTDLGGTIRPRPAYIIGEFLSGGDPEPLYNTDPETTLEVPFRILGNSGLVLLTQRTVKLTGGETKPPVLYLVASYGVTEETTHQKLFYVRTYAIGGGYGTRTIQRPDLVVQTLANYSDATTVSGTSDNTTDVNSEADANLISAALEYQSIVTSMAQYRGIMPISLDGAIRQVTWQVSMHTGAQTWASRNSETEIGVPRRAQRRIPVQVESQGDNIRQLNAARLRAQGQL